MADNVVTRRANTENTSFRNIRERQAIANRAGFRDFRQQYNELNELRLKNTTSLLQFRENSQNRIDQINREYGELTQNVLNDETLAFLVEHSNINAPTLTSIFAGFELARASRADRLNEQREFAIESIGAANERQADLTETRAALIDAQQTLASEQLNLTTSNAAAITDGTAADLTELQRDNNQRQDQESVIERERQTNAARIAVAEINAEARQQQRQEQDRPSVLDFARQQDGFNSTALPNASQPQLPVPAVGDDGLTDTIRAPENVNDIVQPIPVEDDPVAPLDLAPVEEPLTSTPDPELDQFAQRDELIRQFTETQDDALLEPINLLNNTIGVDGLSDVSGIVSTIAALPTDESENITQTRNQLLTNLNDTLANESTSQISQIQSALDAQRKALTTLSDPSQIASMQAAIAQQEQALRNLQS